MNKSSEYLQLLALGFIQRSLTDEDKNIVHELILENPEFREVLKREIVLKRQLQSLKSEIPPSLRARVYRQVRVRKDFAYLQILKPVLEASLPSLLTPFLQLLERRVFVHE